MHDTCTSMHMWVQGSFTDCVSNKDAWELDLHVQKTCIEHAYDISSYKFTCLCCPHENT